MAGDKFDQLYNALKADGAVTGTREHFRKFVYAPGKQGYHNRKQLYDALHADGAVSSNSYEEFAQRLGLHAVNPKPQQKPVAQQKPMTTAQRAMQVPQQYNRTKPLQTRHPRQNNVATPSGTDYMKNWEILTKRNDQMTPLEQARASKMRSRMQNAQKQADIQQQRRATPISKSKITPDAKSFDETMQQLSTPEAKRERAVQQRKDDARNLAEYEVGGNYFTHDDGKTRGTVGNDLLALVDSSINEAKEITRKQYQENLDKMGGIYAPQYVKDKAFRDAQTQEQVNRQNILMSNLNKKINDIYSQRGMQQHILESAEKLNMGVEEYVDKYVTPEIMNYAQKALTMRNQEEIMPHGALDYIAKNLSNSIIGMVLAPSAMSRDTRQRLQEGIAIADGDAEIQKVAGHKDKTYRSGIGTRFVSTAVNMAVDAGPLAGIGAGASTAVNAGTKVLTNGLVKAGVMKAAQKLTAQQMAFKVANMTTAQKIMSGLGTRTATSALNLAGYSGVTAALNQASTGDDTSLSSIAKSGLEGAGHGAITGSMFGLTGAAMAPWVSKFGITGMEKTTAERLLHGVQKVGATATGLGVEAGTMMVADNITGDKDISFGQWLEDVVMVGAFKAGEPSNFVKIGNILHHITHNDNSHIAIGRNENGSPVYVDVRLTPDEKNELISSASGKNLMDAFTKVDRASKTAQRDPKYKTAYTDFMNDPEVSQATKEKVNAALGLFNTDRGRSYRSVNDVQNKQILEYTKNGTLLTRTSYKNADERRAILYKQKAYRDNDEILSLVGMARLKDRQYLDDNGIVKNSAILFLIDKGYDPAKEPSDPSNASLISQLKNEKSALYAEWVKYADRAGIVGEVNSNNSFLDDSFMGGVKDAFGIEDEERSLFSILAKDPMKRTDRENEAIKLMKSELESYLFPNGEPHEEQAVRQGEAVAQGNNLGTMQPEGGAVKAELDGLRQAEAEMDELMRDNDVFGQNFQKLKQQGLTNPQIYDWMVQQGGLTVEQLEPFAHYINANARVQGMQEATKNAIDEQVSSYVQDWSFHGTLNGQEKNGEQAIYVQDSNGRTLLVGTGEVAFDTTTGRAKEGVGDMLVCLDPKSGETVYVKSDEVKLAGTQSADDFANGYRQELQMKNSEPYNQAAQEQAMQDAAKPQPAEKSKDDATKGGDLTKDDTTFTKVYTTSVKDNTTSEDLVPHEQPQPTRKFADGSDVPMTKDSKGRPTPDYEKMTPEQSAEILTEDFGENAEKVVDGQIQKAEKALKDAERIKVDYTAEPNDIMEQEALKKKTVEDAKKQLEHAQNIKKTMTAKKVAEAVGNTEQTEGAHEAGSVAAQKFENAPRLVGNKRTRMLADGETKIRGHYEIVPAESITPSHDVNNGYKKSEGFPTDAEGRTVNDRDYEHDKAAQQNTDQIARKYNGMAIEQVPVVSDEGIVYDGNGRTMAGQKAAKEGTDGEYINDLLENAENFGFTREQIEQSGIEHPRLVLVTDERLPYDTATFSKFNRNEKKTQSNTEQAVAKAKTLTSDEVGAIVAEIEGSGSLDAFFNNSKAINDLVKTLVDKGIIGQNEVAQMMDSPDRLSAQGREYVKNLLLGSIFKPETIRMLGIDSAVKNKAINAIRSVIDNMKLGEFSLRDEIDQAIQLLYEARQGGNKVDTLLRTSDMFGEDAAKRYPSISQMMALALEGKVADFRDLLDEYNRIAASRNTGEGNMFESAPTKEELINEYLNFKKWQDYGTGHSENEGGNDVSGIQEPKQETSGGNGSAEAGAEPERPRVEDTGYKELGATKVSANPKANISERKQALLDRIASGSVKRKDEAWGMLADAEELLAEYYGIPYDEYGGRQRTSSTTIDIVLNIYTKGVLDKITDEPIPAATEKQMNYLMKLAKGEYLWESGLEGMIPNKRQASWLINAMKGLGDEYLLSMHPDEIEEREREIYKGIDLVRKANGANAYDWDRMRLLPREEKPDHQFNPIEAAAAEFKKEHPLTEEEIMKSDVDDLSKDMALDYLNGEVTDDLHRAIYESIYAKRKELNAEPKVDTSKTEPSANPMEEIKNAAEVFEKEKKTKIEQGEKPQQKADDAAVSASNKKVNDLWKELMNAGKDEVSSSFIGLNSRQLEVLPKLVSAMAENAYLRIKRGMHNLEDVVKEMRKEFAPAAKIFKKEDVDAIYEQMMNIRYRDGENRMSLKDWADYYEKTSPKHQENLVGDSKTAEERKQAEKKFIDAVKLQLAFGRKFKSIVELRKFAERHGLKDIKDTDLQELVEAAIVQRARSIAASEATDNAGKFKRILNLYENQPSLNQRDSERVMKQQYSTPAPYAFLADMYVKGNGKEIKSALEPSAGNGILTIGLPKDAVHVNDIDAQRLENLRRQGFKNVTSQDGTQPFADKDVDVVVTNPPFGSAIPKEYDGYKISSLEGQMAINALESMKDDGRAAIIIGGKTEYAKNGSLNPKDKAFLGYLYSHYNVEDVINVDGSLYAKQGTSYPTRIILINGRRLDENAFPPVKDKARADTVKDYDELYKRIEDDILRGERMDSSIGGETRSAQPELDKQGSADTPKERVRAGERGGSKPNGEREPDLFDSATVSGTHDDLENQRGTEPRQDGELPNGDSRADGTGTEPSQSKEPTTGTNEQRGNGSGGAGRTNAQPSTDESTNAGSGSGPRGQLQRVDKSVRGLSTEKVTYTPKSGNPFTLKAVMPADQQDAVNKNLEKLGDADQFLVDELGYNDKDDLYSHLAAEQVDSVALALQQAKKGNAFIIGDMTGIGKGRQAASLIRYAKKQGQVPVYFTKTAGLLSDVYRDLVDIGSPDLRPFVFGSAKEAAITDSDGKVVFALPSKSEVNRVLDYIEKNGKLPDEYDYVLTTYSQVSNGVYEFDENGARKEKKLAKGKTFGAAALSGQRRRDAIEKLMDNAYLVLDESHTAGGNSGQGNYFQHIIQKAKNVTFFSATFAKRPDNMPIYALRTAMNDGGMKSSDLIDAVKRGGATLQEIMSQTLTQCGQMIRRERDMTGVTIDWKAIDDPERVQEQREQYDSIIGLFNDIINFQKKYVSSYVDERNEELAAIQSTIGIKKGTAALGIKNQPFASKAFNTVQQVLLSLKAKSAAERAIDYLKQGMKPVIALNNTNESQTGNLALGEEMDAPDLGTSLKKGLEGTLRYTKKDAKDNSESGYIKLSDLGDEAVEAYHELEKKIEQTSTGLSLSPIDVIKNELQKAGYKVGELTGRQTEFVYNDNGTVTKVKRADTDKKKLARDFNDGKIDALILNKSAATGISLHASSKYKDQKKRVMIVAQQQLDVNDEVQMRGRIDRTGQVARGAYEYVVSLIPAEQRLLMMFKAKLKSLDANTTSSQKSKFNEMEVADITNKYGDKVVKEYMAEHLDLYSRMADPFGWEKTHGDDLSRIDPQTLVASGGGVGDGEAGADASKLLGRMALLRVSEQEKMLQEIGELYANEIQRLNEMGENDLEITELPLKAKTLHKEVWKQGAEPGGDNAFADNTYIEKVNMAILKKPMKAAEVKASQDGLTGGKTWEEYKTEKKAAVKEYFDQKISDETQKYEERAVKTATKAKEKYIKDAKKGQKDSGMSDEQIEKMAGYQYDNIYKQEKDKLNDVMKNLKAKAEMFERVLDTFDTNHTFVLPTDMNNPNELSGFGNSYGRLIDIKITDNYSPNASSVSFATLDGRRKITFPIAGKVGSGENKVDIIGSIDRMTKQAAGMGDSHLRVLNQDLNNWDRLTSNDSRKDGYIVTGNLMQALVDSKDQGLGGQLVKYTTDTGEVKTGILMPDRFDPNGLTTDAPINSVAEKFELSSWRGGIDEVTSSDGEVKVTRIDNYRGYYFEIRVPKSKAKGGKYFMDEDLLKLVDGNNFETRGNNMLAEFKPEQLKPVLDRLSKMGVKVQEERKTSEDEGTHFREDRGLQYSKTGEKDVKNSRIIPEDVDKNVSSQIEKTFDSAIEEIVENAEDRDKSRLVDDADHAVDEFSNLGRSVIEYYRNEYERKVEKLSGQPIGGHLGGKNDGKGNRGSYLLQYYKTNLAVADRELAYRDVRAKNLRETWGLQPGGAFALGDVERIFNETNRDKAKAELFQKALDISKRLGVNIKVSAESPNKASGEAYINRNIDLYIDGLVKTKAPDDSVPTIMLHEMIHEATMGAINLVKKGKAEGVLTPKQIEGVKTILEIYDLVKDDKERFKEDPYGLTDAYELTAQMADSRQRKAMDLSILDRVVNAAHEFAKKGDRSILQRVKDAMKKLFEISDKDKMDKALNDIMDDFNETIDDISMNEIEQEGFAYKVTDKDELDRLNKEKTFRMYSGMQEVDGKLYSPMAAIIDGKRTDATEIGAWMGADERPDLVKNGKFTLVKTDKNKGVGEGDVPAAYNPYMHTSTSMMNDQFTGAYARGNIKVVEWEIPESEKTSGYHAEGAKDAVGLVHWHSGSVNSLLPKDRQRQVMLSRWRKAVRVVPDSEVAESIAEQLKGTGLAIPWNVVTPNQVRELAKLGVPITTVESGRQAPETKEKFLQQMADLEQEFPQAKFVNVKMTKDAFKVWGKDSGTKFRTDHGDGNYPASSVENHVEKVAQKTGGKVKMVSSVDEITNKAAKAAIEEGRKITGWYDENTGEVHLYMPNIHDRYTAEKTIWHEVVGHKGMRELFGEERFEKFLRDVWYDLDKPENAALKKLVDEERKFNPMNIYGAIEEGIARLAEDGKGETGFWNGIKNKVSDFLHEIGYRIAPNTKDVKYLLWLSKNLQKNPNDPYWKLRAEAVKFRLDHEDIRSVVSHDGVFYENDGKARSLADLPKADYQEATDGQIHFRTTPTAATALDRYHRSLDAHGYMATESYMDNMLSLKKLMNAIAPDKKIEDIASSENPYILQNVMQGAMSNAAKMFEINIMSPLEKAMAGVLDAFEGKKTDDKIRNFNLYMITKHGLERNRVLFVRDAVRKLRMDDSTKADAEKLQSEWDVKKEDLGNQLKSGIIDLKRYYEKMDEWIRDNVNKDYEAGEHDYSGMHGVQDIISMKDPYNDGEAIQSVMDSEAKMESVKAGSVRDYWDKVRAATRYSVDSDYNNGIIDRDLHEHVSKMFDWYVPLRNYDETTAEDVYGYITEIGDQKNRIGSTIAKARGHKYLSETNILAQIGALGNRAIKNGGDNAIKQAFARFARNHSKNNLIKETSVWYVKDPATGIVEERYPDIPEGATADEINQIVSDFDTDMAMLKAQGLATKKFDRGNIGYRFERAKDKSQHIVDVMIAGKKHSFVILGNPRAAQALNGMLEHKNESLVGRTTSAISRFMAQTCTSYNPEFVMRNMIRDFEFASTNLLAKEGMAYTKTFEKYYAQVGLIEGIRNTELSDFKKMTGFGLFSKYRNGTLDTSDKIQRYFKEFMENGGETGWVQIKNMKDLTSEYKLHVKTEKNGKTRVSKNVFDFIFKNLENANEVAENLARFATYCASRDAGRSTVRSAYDAKEVSVNFNRHGSGNAIYSFKNGEMSNAKTARKNVYGFWASWFRNSSMFFNAGVQSTNLLIKNFKNNKAGTIGYIMAGPMMSGMAMALINNMLIASEDEKDRKGVKDPYGELPDYIRRNNLCIYVGGGEFITIPLAIEERAFYGLGDLAAGLTFSKNISGQKNPALDAVGCMSQLVPVADYLGNASFGKNPGEETIKAIAPSAVSPIIEWFFNSDWKGAPIHRDNKFDENQPSWMLAYKGTPEWLININKKANAWSNDVAPGNENMKGNDFLDAATDPSLLQHLYSSYLGGAATFMERVGGLVKKGKDTETKDIPFVRSMFYTPSEQTSLQRTKSKWYNYLDETEKMIANAKRLKSKKVPLDELVKNYGDYYKFKQSKGAEKMNVIETATKEMKKWKELRNKSNDAESINFANQNIDYIMMRAVNELDKLN